MNPTLEACCRLIGMVVGIVVVEMGLQSQRPWMVAVGIVFATGISVGSGKALRAHLFYATPDPWGIPGLSERNVSEWLTCARRGYLEGDLESWEFDHALQHCLIDRKGPLGADGRPMPGQFALNGTGGYFLVIDTPGVTSAISSWSDQGWEPVIDLIDLCRRDAEEFLNRHDRLRRAYVAYQQLPTRKISE